MPELIPDPARSALDAELTAWMAEPWELDDARFDALARRLFAFQFEHCEPYARFCRGRGVDPSSLASWEEIPPVPTGAFKEVALRSFPRERRAHVFRTSGTATERRGELWLDTLLVYEASLVPTFARFVLPDLAAGRRARLLVLAPSPGEVPDSSLSHMFGAVLERYGDTGSGFFVVEGTLDEQAILAALDHAARGGEPVALCGTAFALVHLLDGIERRGAPLSLPAGRRVMETGGFKGRARERPQAELYGEIETRLGIPPERIVNQYGMTELGSQFYDSVLFEPGGTRRKLAPPWARIRSVDPSDGRPCPEGEIGILVVHDLANSGSVLAVQTADLGRVVGDGFEVIGREPGAEARGCSIAADEMLGGTP